MSLQIFKELHNLLYQNPCLINFFASIRSLCLFTKVLKLSQILLILKSCEMYTLTRYVARPCWYITAHEWIINSVKIKVILAVNHIYKFATIYTNRYIQVRQCIVRLSCLLQCQLRRVNMTHFRTKLGIYYLE